ncbi:MAG TPA: YobA family protein [Candidatus Olsenella avicola]|nr:YobA family protein [Candidatus Olsenella avicola]
MTSRKLTVLLAATLSAVLVMPLAACSKSEPPTGTVRLETEEAVVNAAMLTHGYSWDNAAVDPVPPTELTDDDVPDVEISETTEVTASFSQPATEVEVVRYAEDGTLEGVECSLEDGAATFEIEPGWRYYVGAWFEGGDAGYLFDAKGTEGEGSAMDEFVSTAMVVTFDDGEVLFVDQDTGTPYYPTLPEGAPELTAGNIVRVTGNGIMLESYPGQYPGITRVEVVEEGSPADAEKYDELVAEIWQPKDPAEPPLASLEYTTELAVITLLPTACGYTWTYEQDGKEQTVAVDAPHPTQLEADELPDARVDGPTEVTVSFDVEMAELVVSRWSEDALDVEGEPVEAEDGTFIVEPGYRYAFFATFDAGGATYVFTVRS